MNCRAVDFAINFPTLKECNSLPQIAEESYRQQMPNPLRAIANGRPMYTIMIDVWHDDVSGNRSKSYNKHNNTYIANRSLPRRLLQQEFHVHFAGTSQHASPTEQFAAVKEMMQYVLANILLCTVSY